MDIRLAFFDDRVEGSNVLEITARESIGTLCLNARDLDIRSVDWRDDSAPKAFSPLGFDVVPERNELRIHLPRRIAAGETFSVRCVAVCRPSERILEGIYRDTTPPGCPPQYMSQCQQWGFQRILPVYDDCTAKCTMTTTIEADARYTHLISNGDVDRRTNPDGRPVLKPGDPSRKVVTYRNAIPMAPYLFIVCVGTWDALEDEVVYPSGRRVKLEYLVPPGRRSGAVLPMQITQDAVLWQGRTQDYEYAREVYRTICMEKSNFGGMENVGNTTIVTDAAMVDAYTTDRRIEYAHAVIAHEFEHNQCGSDVTMETPFDMWLNEAFTVDVDRQFMMSRFDPVCMRLEQVDAMRAPVSGPLAIEDGGHLGQIVRDGFNDPDELVDGVTYVKAAEVIRMLRLILGAEVFRRSKNLYFQRYGGGNANTDQFFACFEEVSGRNLSAFKREWLYTIGYPAVTARWRYEEATRTLHIKLRQARSGAGGLFHFPVELAAVDEGGRDIPGTARVVEMGDPRSAVPGGAPSADLSLDLPNVPRPSFVSFNRSGSFYGTFLDAEATPDSLARQIRLDPNRYNRVEAMRRLTDTERIRLIEAPGADVSGAWVQVFADITRDASLEPGLKAYLLRIDEESLDRRYTVRYPERYRARIRLLKTVAEACRDDLLHAFETVDTYRAAARPTDGVEERRLKAVVLRTLTEADTPEVHRLAEAHWRRAWNITDRLAALQCINLSGCPNRPERLEEAYWEWKDHLSAYAGYLQVVGSGTREDVFDRIEVESRRPTFRIEHPTHSRALFAPMATNNKVLWTERGLRWMADTVIRLAPINDNAALRLVNAFQQVRDMGPTLKPGVIRSLQAMKEGVAPSAAPSVAGRIAAYLTGAD